MLKKLASNGRIESRGRGAAVDVEERGAPQATRRAGTAYAVVN
jgi:hypothetical protein